MEFSVNNASFSYRDGDKLLENVSFSVRDGEILAVLGPNGAGKTTLLRCMMGFLNWKSGSATIDGRDVRAMSARELWRVIAYVPQSREAIGSMTARDMILLGCTNRLSVFSSPSKKDREKAEAIADDLGIAHLLDKNVAEMSGGEKQMVLIGRALCAEPSLLILDEPESGLDFRNQLIVLDTLSNLAAKGLAVIFNTHYPEHALSRASKALLIDKNGGALFGFAPSVVTEESIGRVFRVRTAIRTVETESGVYRSILPLSLAEGEAAEAEENADRIAVISAVFPDKELSGRVNAILHEYGAFIVGRMGMPYPAYGVYIVNVTLDAKKSDVEALVQRLAVLSGMHVKVTAAVKGETARG